MCNPLFVAAGMAVISAVGSQQQAQAKAAQDRYNASVAENQAIAYGQEAEIKQRRTEIDQRAIELEKEKARAEFEQERGRNVSMMAAGNVDLSSGSPLAILTGNVNAFQNDMDELDYQRDLIGWSGQREADILKWQAATSLGQSKFIKGQIPSAGQSLFSSALGGVAAGASTYYAAGGGKATTKAKV